jgi:hypothetical protein
MRTTIDVPDEVLKQAKIAAVEHGLTLRELVAKALSRELSCLAAGSRAGQRAQFPIFRSRQPGALQATAQELAGLETAEEARRNGMGP